MARLGGPGPAAQVFLPRRSPGSGEICHGVALKIKERCQIAVVDADIALGGDRGFGVKGDACAGGTQHAKIIRAIANGNHIGGGDAHLGGDFLQRLNFCGPAKDGFGDLARQRLVFDQQEVGAVFIKAERFSDARREGGKTARDEGGAGAI